MKNLWWLALWITYVKASFLSKPKSCCTTAFSKESQGKNEESSKISIVWEETENHTNPHRPLADAIKIIHLLLVRSTTSVNTAVENIWNRCLRSWVTVFKLFIASRMKIASECLRTKSDNWTGTG